MNENLEKVGYSAPRLETTSFKTEQGYAVSAKTQEFEIVNITF